MSLMLASGWDERISAQSTEGKRGESLYVLVCARAWPQSVVSASTMKVL